MAVSTRNTMLAGLSAFSVLIAGGLAFAGGGSGGGQGPTPVPGTNMGGSQSGPCCHGPKGPTVIIPGVNVSGPNVRIHGSNVTVHQGSIVSNTKSYINTTVVGGESNIVVTGGGGYFSAPGMAASAIPNLSVELTEEYCEDEITIKTITRPVQAVCIDDKGVPHPASQVDDQDSVPTGYHGEVFRCMAGTSMQVTLGDLEDGTASFANGETFACRKGEALVHQGDGKLDCAPQIPERSCNERSLLRRHGPGTKLVQYTMSSKTCIPRTRTVSSDADGDGAGAALVLDGGVGQGIY